MKHIKVLSTPMIAKHSVKIASVNKKCTYYFHTPNTRFLKLFISKLNF